ncbi:MAG: hypothetical protein P4L51_10060 [Puia sp.]|nr:hypothetical protein [Puia sp.]
MTYRLTYPSRIRALFLSFSLLSLFSLSSTLFIACSPPEKPVSRQEAMELARRIEGAALHRNPGLLDNIIDEQAFAKRVVAESGKFWSSGLRESAIEGIRSAHFGGQVMQALGKSGTYQLVKQYEKDNRQHLLFRMYAGGSLNYHDLELMKKEEDVRASDVYIYLSGENLSKTLSQALMMVQDNMKNMPKDEIEKINGITTVKTLLAQKDFVKAGKYYDEFPDNFKKEKMFQLIHIQICEGMGDSSYAKALGEYRSLFPHDPNMYLMMIDVYVLQKDYPKALEAVNKLDSMINKDPFQDYYRGLLYKLMGDTVRSRVYLERLHANMPGFGDGTIELIASYVKTGDLDKAVQLARRSRDDRSVSSEKMEMLRTFYPGLQKAMDSRP